MPNTGLFQRIPFREQSEWQSKNFVDAVAKNSCSRAFIGHESNLEDQPLGQGDMNRGTFLKGSGVLGTALLTSLLGFAPNANAAPPMAVIAEELGYFPATNSEGQTTYTPARIKRSSTEQAIELASYLKSVRFFGFTANLRKHRINRSTNTCVP